MLNNEYYDSKIILKRIFFRFGSFGLRKSIDVAYILKLCGLESGAVFERATRVHERIKFCRFNSK